jgi:hypothetical protein
MGIVVSLLLIAVGAIMRFAVTVEGNGFNVGTVGMILMLIGALGAVLSIAFWASWGGLDGLRRRRTVVMTEPVQTTTTVTEHERI